MGGQKLKSLKPNELYNLFKKSLNAIPYSFIIINVENYKVVALNNQMALSLDKTEEELIGKNILDYFPQETERIRKKYAELVIKTKKPQFFEDERNGRWFSNQFYPLLDDKEKVTHGIIFVEEITKSKKAEKSQKESEEKFRMLSEQSLMGLGIVQEENILYANNAITHITGYTKKEMFRGGTKILMKIVHPDYLSFVQEQLQKKLAGDKDVVSRYSCKIITKSDEIKWVEIFSKTIKFEGKNADFITFVDITDQKNAEELVKISEEKYRLIFESSSEAIVMSNINGRILEVNSAASEILGYDIKELVGSIATLGYVYPEQRKLMLQKLMKDGFVKNYELIFKKKDGSHVHTLGSASLIFNKDKKVERIVGIFSDISERVKSELEIKKTKDYLQKVIDSASEVIFTIDSNYKIRTWNKTAENIIGVKKKQIVGKYLKQINVFENLGEIREYMKQIIQNKKGFLPEMTINTVFGTKRILSISPSYIRDSSDNISEFLFVCRDITLERELYGKLKIGNNYIISENEINISLEIFKGLIKTKMSGLYIGRKIDDRVKNEFFNRNVKIIKLSEEKTDDTSIVTSLEELYKSIKAFVSKNSRSVVLIGRVDYLISNYSFDKIIKILYRINDLIQKHNSILLLRVNPSIINKQQLSVLNEEFDEIPSQKIRDIQISEDLFGILEYIHKENIINKIVTYSKIGSKFNISKVTVKKRIEALLDFGLIYVKKQGKTKILNITKKGINILK